MSCIAGIVNLDGAPADRVLLEDMLGAMKGRAPDGSAVRISGNVGLGHAMLRTTPEADTEHQPCTLDGTVWITADCRVDGRVELIGKLRTRGESVRDRAPDVELLLHAYRAWGEALLEHILGDFAFALWDDRSKTLLCARDHFGVRPFYYARTDRHFLFASNVDALLRHPVLSRELDENAVGEFILFGAYHETESSIYRDIRRLPAAACMRLSMGESRLRQYWTLSESQAIRYRSLSEYAEHFQAVFELAVSDRLRSDAVALELSGGLDSTSIAAVASAHGAATGRSYAAHTNSSTQLLPDDREGHFAQMVATHLNIPLRIQEIGTRGLFEIPRHPALRTAEPTTNPYLSCFHDSFAAIVSSGARVLVTGQWGDALFNTSMSTYFGHLLRSGRLFDLLGDMLQHVRHTGSLRGMGLRNALSQALRQQKPRPQNPDWRPRFPDWLNADFVRRTGLEARWDAAWHGMLVDDASSRPQLRLPWLSQLSSKYELFDLPLVVRHPFLDLRLVDLLLGFPGHVKAGKMVVREAMRGRLPEPIRVRPKTGLSGDLVRAALMRTEFDRFTTHINASAARGYIDNKRHAQAFARYIAGEDARSVWSTAMLVTPIGLGLWLNNG